MIQSNLVQYPRQTAFPAQSPVMPMQPQGPQAYGVPVPLNFEADKSTGLADDRGGQVIDTTDLEQVGLPGHRILDMVSSWASTKSGELTRMLECDAFYDGDVWTAEQLKELAERGQSPSHIPIAHAKIDSYIGIGHRLRRDPKAYPVTFKHTFDANVATMALRSVDQSTNGKEKYSESSKDFFVRGVGALWQGVTIGDDGKPEICKRRIAGTNFIYDPRSMEATFSDAKYLGEWNWVDVEDAQELFMSLGRPDSAQKCEYLVGHSDGNGMAGVPTEFLPGGDGWYDQQRKRLRIVKLYYRYKKKWHCCYVVGRIKLYDAESIYKDEKGASRQPYNATSCYVGRTGERSGVMKLMMPLQREINFRSSKLTWLIGARQILYEEGAVPDINEFGKQMRRPNGVMKVNVGALANKRIQVENINSEIKGQFDLLEQAKQELRSIGPNPALLGKGEGVNSQSGRAILALQNAGMAEMSTVFERHREFKLQSYRNDWLLIRQFWKNQPDIALAVLDDEKKAQRLILNEVQTDAYGRPVNVQNPIALMDIDLVMEEGPDVTIMKEEMMQIISQAGNMPSARLKTIIKLSNVPNQDELMSLLDEENPKPDPEMADLEKRMNLLKVAEQAVKVDKTYADTIKTHTDSLGVLVDKGIPSSALQAAPFDLGVNTFLEDVLGEEIHPMGSAFNFEPAPVMEPMPMQDGPPDAMGNPGPSQPAPMQQKPMAQIVPNAPALPGEEIMHNGAPGSLPMPPPGQDMPGMLPPGNARI